MEGITDDDYGFQYLQERRNIILNRQNSGAERAAAEPVVVQPKKRRLGTELDRVTAPGVLRSLGTAATFASFPVNRYVEIWMGTDAGGGTSYYKAFEINITLARSPDADPYQRCAYFAGALACITPSIYTIVENSCSQMGSSVTLKHVPRDLSEVAYLGLDNVHECIDVSKAIVMWALIVFMLYKNPSAVNFEEFCRRRLRAMVNVGGVIGEDNLVVFNDVEAAQNFRKTYGQNHSLRREVLRSILTIGSDQGPLTQVGNYIKSILQWTDMAGYYFVFQTLIMTNSPLLEHPDLVSEVRQYTLATVELAKVDIPSYYRILEDPSTYANFERQKFPTLIAVARELKARTSKTVSQFVTTASDIDTYISKLVSHHNSLRAPIVNARIERDIQLLTQEGYRDYED